MKYQLNLKTFKTLRLKKNQIKSINDNITNFLFVNKINNKEIFIYRKWSDINHLYTEQDALKQYFFYTDEEIRFPHLDFNLVPEYYKIKEKWFLNQELIKNQKLYDEVVSKRKFKEKEIEWSKNFDLFSNRYSDKILREIKYLENKGGIDYINQQVENYYKWLTEENYSKNLSDLIKEKYYDKILLLMKEINIIDYENKCLLNNRNMSPLSALIYYLNFEKYFKRIAEPHIKNSEQNILSYFNRFLGTSYKRVSTKSKDFKSLKGIVNQYFIANFSK